MEKHPKFLANFLNEGVYLVDDPMMVEADSGSQAVEENEEKGAETANSSNDHQMPEDDDQESSSAVEEPEGQEEQSQSEQAVEEETAASTDQGGESSQNVPNNATTEILVLVNYSSGTALKVKDQLVLSNILKALSKSINEVTTINTGNAITDFHAIMESYQPRVVLAFGLSTDYFSGKVTLNELQSIQGTQVVLAPPVAEIAQDRTLKQKLWANLKAVFS